MTGVLKKEKKIERPFEDRSRDWITLSKATKCLGPLEAERGKPTFFPQVSEEVWSCWYLDFRFTASKFVRE